MFKSISPNLMVEDVEKTMEYYTDIFGAVKGPTVPETGKLEWSMVTIGSVALMFQSRESMSKEWPEFKDKNCGGTLGFYIDVNNVRNLFEKIKDKVHVEKPLNKTFYGATEFTIIDLNGYCLTFAEDESER